MLFLIFNSHLLLKMKCLGAGWQWWRSARWRFGHWKQMKGADLQATWPLKARKFTVLEADNFHLPPGQFNGLENGGEG